LALCANHPIDNLRSFVYVPRAVNLLREREQHIAKLQTELILKQRWLEETRAERTQLHAALEAQKHHLEEQNRWALDLEQRWRSGERRIVQLQDEYAALERAVEEQAARREARIAELENWGRETERRLTAEVEQFRVQLGETVRLLESAEATVQERSRWALDCSAKLENAEAQLAAARASRWMRTGRLFGVGPNL